MPERLTIPFMYVERPVSQGLWVRKQPRGPTPPKIDSRNGLSLSETVGDHELDQMLAKVGASSLQRRAFVAQVDGADRMAVIMQEAECSQWIVRVHIQILVYQKLESK
jgi:hypothetical protein